MHLTIDRNDLLRSVQAAAGAVPRNAAMPVLAHVHLAAEEDGTLRVRGMDLGLAIEATTAAKVSESGETTVNAQRLLAILKELPELPVEFEADQDCWIQFRCGNADFKLVGIPAERYPAFPAPPASATPAFTLPAALLRDALPRVIFAAAADASRAAFSGVLIVIKGDTMELVATDGHRLAHLARQVDVALPKGEPVRLLVPRAAFDQLGRMLVGGEAETVRVYQDGARVTLRLGASLLSCCLVEARFPNYEMVIPKDNPLRVRLSREALRSCIRRVGIFAEEQFHGISFALSEDRLRISGKAKDLGYAQEDLAVDYKGKDVTVIVNTRYVQEMLSVMDGEECEWQFKSDTSGIWIVDPEKTGAGYVLMPMKV